MLGSVSPTPRMLKMGIEDTDDFTDQVELSISTGRRQYFGFEQ